MRMAVSVLRRSSSRAICGPSKAPLWSFRHFSTTTSSTPQESKTSPESSSLPKSKPKSRALALSVYFHQPELGMTDYEILSRASAFLLAVDPPDDEEEEEDETKSPYERVLNAAKQRRDDWKVQQEYLYKPAGGPRGRALTELGWLEFCPDVFRPRVHCMAASHVLEPFRWPTYYPQPWLQHVKLEHCAYSLEVFDFPSIPSTTQYAEPLAKFALNPYPIHHPEDYDVAMLHLKSEDTVLPQLQKLGVEILHLRQDDKAAPMERDEEVYFEGFEITQDSSSHLDELPDQKLEAEEDTRIFVPYASTGRLIYASPERFLADTKTKDHGLTLPEGLCGGPTLDSSGHVCGIVEGIIPLQHKDARLAGAASFLPSFQLRAFVEYAERIMLKEIMPPDMFEQVEEFKAGNYETEDGKKNPRFEEKIHIDKNLPVTEEYLEAEAKRTFDKAIHNLRKEFPTEQVDAILATIERERKEVQEILKREGGNVEDIIEQVRARTWATRDAIMAQQEKIGNQAEIQEAEVVPDNKEEAPTPSKEN